MKLHVEPKPSKARATDVLQTPEPEKQDWDFDVMRDVPAKVWDWADKMIEKLIERPSTYELFARHLCRLAAVNPELKTKLRNSPQLRDTILEFFKTDWGKLDSTQVDPVFDLAEFLLIFPEFRDQQIDTEVKFEEMMQAVRYFVDAVDTNYWYALAKLIILFPEKQSEILAYAQEIKSDILPVPPPQLGKPLGYVMELSAGARLLFPGDTQQILETVQPHWKTLLRSIQHDDPGDNILPVFQAVVLSAESATITPDGNLKVVPRPKQLQKRRELPVRPTA